MAYVEISLIGAECESFISHLISEGIKLWEVKNVSNEFFMRMNPYYYSYAARLAKSYKLRTRIIKKHGLLFSLNPMRKRYGIMAGCAAGLAIISILSQFSWVIDISGNSKVSDNQILSYLEEYGIEKGRLRADMNADRAELLAPVRIDDIAWMSVEFDGSRIWVKTSEIREGEKKTVAQSSPCNVVSDRNALIVEADVYSGVLEAPLGGGIKEGEIIISGIVADQSGNLLYNHASGRIIGEYTVEEVFSADYRTMEKIPSDEKITQNHLVIFGFDFPLFFEKFESNNAICSESCEIFDIMGFKLPWEIRSFTYNEYTETEVIRGDEDLRRILKQKKEMYEKNFLKNTEIISFDEGYASNDEGMVLRVSYKVRGEIGQAQEIFINNQ